MDNRIKSYIENIKNGIFVEIGTDSGNSAEFFLENTDESNILYCIDPYTSYTEYEDSINFVTGDHLYLKTVNRLKRFGNRVKFIRKFSRDAIHDIPNNIDFLYIDGNHSYKYVLKDLELYCPKLKNEGFCLCDDAVDIKNEKRDIEGNVFIEWGPNCSGKYGVLKAIKDFIIDKKYVSIELQNQYLLIKKKDDLKIKLNLSKMNKILELNNEKFRVKETEYNKIYNDEFNNLKLLSSLAYNERIVSLLNELLLTFEDSSNKNLSIINIQEGGYIPIKCASKYRNIYIYNNIEENNENIKENIFNFDIKNIYFTNKPKLDSDILFLNDSNFKDFDELNNSFIISTLDLFYNLKNIIDYIVYTISNSNLFLYIHKTSYNNFLREFRYFIEINENLGFNNTLNYDNLIHYTMIIKNGGDTLENVLNENLPFIDRWTILDTGSTDNTIEIINKVLVGKKKGKLYSEPFINFRDSRNRCLDLAGKDCKFLIMLDDTYSIKGDLRFFLNTVRSDQFSNSFSLYIKSNDVEYTSNRIIKSESNLRYKYKIHEVINPENNKNVIVPINHSLIFDYRSDYMENRTMTRKQYDLKVLFETIEEEPNDSRAYYYIAQTYNLLEDYENALKYYLERVNHPDEGFIQEKIDAYFEAGRMCNFRLNKPWQECEELYKKSYELDPSRPDSLYFIGIHYYLEAINNIDSINNYRLAYEYMKKGFEIGYPLHCQYSLKPTLSFYFLPKFLSELCYFHGDYILGQKCSQLFLDSNKPINGVQPFKEIFIQSDYEIVDDWNKIFKCLNIVPLNVLKNKLPENKFKKPYLCFLADGGFESWTGKDILYKGVGGSETYVIEMAKYIQELGIFNVIVFCKCPENEIFENVEYRKLMEFYDFITKENIHTCIVSRYSEYIPVCLVSENIKNVYLLLHDLIASGRIIPRNDKIKRIICLSNWHVEHFTSIFPNLKDITIPFNYGIDFKLFLTNETFKIPYKFIYSSFAHRGLLPLLQMWPKIIEKYPSASLHIHCDVENNWVNSMRPDEMKLIKQILNNYKNVENINIFYHGWTDKKTLAENWKSSHIWFYPCTFLETFCLTALEAAITKTFVITRDFGGLKDTVGDRGVMLDSKDLLDPYTQQWQDNAINKLFEAIDNKQLQQELIEKNYNWAINMSWKSRAYNLIENYIYDLPSSHNLNQNFVDYIKWKTNNKPLSILEILPLNTIGSKFLELFEKSYLTTIDHTVNIADYLLELIKNNENTYDFIYINESNNNSENYTNIVIAFKLLKNDGMIYFNSSVILKEIYDFLEKYKNQINIIDIHDKNEIFIEKI